MSGAPKVLLVGECNPYSTDPADALLPWPAQAAGNRLRMILDLTEKQYLAQFDRANLFAGRRPGTKAEAQVRALEILTRSSRLGRRAYVLLGRSVAHAFARVLGIDAPPPFLVADFANVWGDHEACALLALPHPSGRCREWNTPGARERARVLVQAARSLNGMLATAP